MTGDQPTWRKSSYSGSQTACVEVASLPYGTGIRDSKSIDGGELRITGEAWRSFVAAVRAGRM